jgi:hypothetical protein
MITFSKRLGEAVDALPPGSGIGASNGRFHPPISRHAAA